MQNEILLSHDQQLASFIASHPLPIPKDLILDGSAQRFGEGEKGREPHWYIGKRSEQGIILTVGSHKDSGAKTTFKTSRALWKKDASIIEKWESCKKEGMSPYLECKKIHRLFGARINFHGSIVIPMLVDGQIVGLQTINGDGKKLFVKGSRKKGAYFELEGSSNKSKIIVAEGFATAASVLMATTARTICAFDAGNIPAVVEAVRNKWPQTSIIVAADDDRFCDFNAGRNAAAKANVTAIFPVFSSDADKPTDWNDLHVREGLDEVKRQLKNERVYEVKQSETDQKKEVERIPALTGGELDQVIPMSQESFLLPGLVHGQVGMLCAPGGFGKSGFALLLAHQIAIGSSQDFLGFGPMKEGLCVYLSLEDSAEILKTRRSHILEDLSKQERELAKKNFILLSGLSARHSVDRDEIISIIRKKIKKESTPLRLLIIDHVSLWSNLDLNDHQDSSKIMADFIKISEELQCSVIFLHHTNKAGVSQGLSRQSGIAAAGGNLNFSKLARWVGMLEGLTEKSLKIKFKISSTKEKFDSSGLSSEYRLLKLEKINHAAGYQILLKHNVDRGGLLYKSDFEAKKVEKKCTSQTAGAEVEIIPKEEVENFNMGEASPKLVSVDENTHHIMNWLSRNPAFETVSPSRRKELTASIDGKEHDKDRPAASIYKDVWVNGDTLIIDGPVCDQEDMKLFALLVNELSRLHNDGARGLILEISLSQILTLSGLNISGPNFNRVHRQLNRLRRMALDFKNSRGHRWRGPLINDVFTIGEGRNCKVRIGFNHFMVTFYKIQEYTMFQKSIAQGLKGDSLSFYIFYASQNLQSMKISVEKCKKLLGIAPTFDKKEAMKKIKKSINDLVAAGVMDPAKTFIKDGNVHTYRAGEVH